MCVAAPLHRVAPDLAFVRPHTLTALVVGFGQRLRSGARQHCNWRALVASIRGGAGPTSTANAQFAFVLGRHRFPNVIGSRNSAQYIAGPRGSGPGCHKQ